MKIELFSRRPAISSQTWPTVQHKLLLPLHVFLTAASSLSPPQPDSAAASPGSGFGSHLAGSASVFHVRVVSSHCAARPLAACAIIFAQNVVLRVSARESLAGVLVWPSSSSTSLFSPHAWKEVFLSFCIPLIFLYRRKKNKTKQKIDISYAIS